MPPLAPRPQLSPSPSLLRSLSLPLGLFLALLLALAVPPATRATSILPPTFAELVAEAETIARGTVTAVRSEAFDSPQGRGIHTFVTVRVERTLKGTPADTVTLRLLGGTVGKRTLRVVGVPTFAIGQRQLVFVARNGEVMCPLIGAGHGRYHVLTDTATQREYLTRDNAVPLTSTDEIVLPLSSGPTADLLARRLTANQALSLASFETQIMDTLARATAPQRP
jgi:hypothetical protein